MPTQATPVFRWFRMVFERSELLGASGVHEGFEKGEGFGA